MHPIAFHFGQYAVHWYGVMMALAFVAGLWTASRRGLRGGFAPEKILDLGPWLIIGGLVGARAFYVATYWQEAFADKPVSEIFMIQHGGLVFYGGFIGASVACVAYARLKRLPLWKLADVLAPSIALGYVFGRFGCFLNGCCYGRVCTLPWAIHFSTDHETYGLSLHPTQIYDALLSLGLYALLANWYRRKKFDGQVLSIYLICYAFTRSLVEYFRGDYSARHIHAGLTPAHWISILILTTGLALYGLLRRSQTRTRQSAQARDLPRRS